MRECMWMREAWSIHTLSFCIIPDAERKLAVNAIPCWNVTDREYGGCGRRRGRRGGWRRQGRQSRCVHVCLIFCWAYFLVDPIVLRFTLSFCLDPEAWGYHVCLHLFLQFVNSCTEGCAAQLAAGRVCMSFQYFCLYRYIYIYLYVLIWMCIRTHIYTHI